MPEFTSYDAGTPSWVDHATKDLEASNAFYGALFGWEAEDQGEEMGHYNLMRKGGKTVAGNMSVMTEAQPSAWVTYVSVDNADATVDLAKKAGGMVFAEPMDVADIGRMAVFADPEGAVIGVWQPKTFKGAELANEAGAFAWNELNTRDLSAAKVVLHRGVRVEAQRSRHGRNELHRMEARRQAGGWHDGHARHGAGGGSGPLARLLRG